MTALFLREVYRAQLLGQTELTFSAPVQLLLSLAVVAGAALQLRWGWLISQKLRQMLFGNLESPRAALAKAKAQ